MLSTLESRPYESEQASGGGSRRPRRTKRKKSSSLFGRSFKYMIFVLIAALILTLFMFSVARDFLSLGKPEAEATVTITDETTLDEVAMQLKQGGIISHSWAFKVFASITKNAAKFQNGIFTVTSDMDYLWICSRLKSTSARETVWVTIPEGLELREIFALLETNKVCSADALYDSMENDEFDYDFISQIPAGRENAFEGYLFPDTYEFYQNDQPKNVLNKMLSNFNLKYDEEMLARTQSLGMTIDEVVILASIVEREAAGDEDRDVVASVFLNRLNSTNYPYLQSCATVQYVLQERKAVLSVDDTRIDSPYNTYVYQGLPVGPISAPGKASLKAVLWPASTDYYFFVLGENGEHIFSRTYEQHLSAIQNARNSSGTGTVIE